jgi:signal transduction histidine kinase
MASGAVVERSVRRDDTRALRVFFWTSSAVLIAFVGSRITNDIASVQHSAGTLVLWVLAAAAGDLLVVRLNQTTALSMSLPVTLAAAMLFAPGVAGLVALLGSLDLMELRGESSPTRIVFNRAQVSAAVTAASLAFHLSPGSVTVWPAVLIWSTVALLVDCACNISLVIAAGCLETRRRPLEVIAALMAPEPVQKALLYLALGIIAPLIALAYQAAGWSALIAFLAPLAIARAALLQGNRLHFAEVRISEKDAALRLSNDLIRDERRDERLALAGELHDELLPSLFKVHLMGQVLRQDLVTGRLFELDEDLPGLLTATEVAQVTARDLVRDLRRSPLGPAGLVATIELLIDQLQASSGMKVSPDLQPVSGTEAAQLVAYQVIREALNNAAKYARADEVAVRLWSEGGLLRILVCDNGVGFNSQGVDSSRHFGLQLMRERVDAAGGSLVIDSGLGRGTTVAAVLPPDV